MCVNVYMWVQSSEVSDPLAARDVGGCELPGVGSGNQTRVSAKAV